MELAHFTAPRSIAVIGASDNPDKIGGRPIAFLQRAGFPRAIYPVNPRAETVQGLKAYPSIEELPDDVDLAVVALPAKMVPETIEALGGKHVKAAVVFASDLDKDQTSETLVAARKHGMRLLGPNTLGLFSTSAGCFATFATALDGAWPKSGPIAILSQSGAFGSYLYALIDRVGGGISHMITTGNGLDLDLPEWLDALAKDPGTSVVVLAFEGIRDGRALMAAIARLREAGKPVVAMKSGQSAAGQAAAATHTGALAGEDAVLDAALEAAGAIRTYTIREAAELATVLAQGLRMPGKRLGVVTTSGGVGVLVSDYAEVAGLDLPVLPEEAQDAIHAVLPMAGTRNPVDSSTGILADFSLFGKLLEQVQESGAYDALYLYLAHIGRNPEHWAGVLPAILAARTRRPDMPLVISMLAHEGPRQIMTDHTVPVFEDPADAMRLLGLLARFSPPLAPVETETSGLPPLPDGTLNEADAMQWLADAGIPVPETRLVGSPEEAAGEASSLPGKLAVKIASPDILHKTEIGGVLLGVDPKEAATAVRTVMEAARSAVPEAHIDGAVLAEMVEEGPELIVGTMTDPSFGPVIMVGLGGVTAELLRDVTFAIAPISENQAEPMLDRLKGVALLDGYRGGPKADRDALCRLIAKISQLAAAGADRELNIEINPLRIRPDGRPVCLDAVVTAKNLEMAR